LAESWEVRDESVEEEEVVVEEEADVPDPVKTGVKEEDEMYWG
jgi:hypothetical protein